MVGLFVCFVWFFGATPSFCFSGGFCLLVDMVLFYDVLGTLTEHFQRSSLAGSRKQTLKSRPTWPWRNKSIVSPKTRLTMTTKPPKRQTKSQVPKRVSTRSHSYRSNDFKSSTLKLCAKTWSFQTRSTMMPPTGSPKPKTPGCRRNNEKRPRGSGRSVRVGGGGQGQFFFFDGL